MPAECRADKARLASVAAEYGWPVVAHRDWMALAQIADPEFVNPSPGMLNDFYVILAQLRTSKRSTCSSAPWPKRFGPPTNPVGNAYGGARDTSPVRGGTNPPSSNVNIAIPQFSDRGEATSGVPP
jgi:hypothetical protein